MAGRLTLEELEQRLEVAVAAHDHAQLASAMAGLPAPALFPPLPRLTVPRPSGGDGVVGLVLGIVALVLLMMSFGLLSFFTMPLSISAWILGRSARRQADKQGLPRPSTAQPGEVLGIVGTVLSCVLLAGCAAFVV